MYILDSGLFDFCNYDKALSGESKSICSYIFFKSMGDSVFD